MGYTHPCSEGEKLLVIKSAPIPVAGLSARLQPSASAHLILLPPALVASCLDEVNKHMDLKSPIYNWTVKPAYTDIKISTLAKKMDATDYQWVKGAPVENTQPQQLFIYYSILRCNV